jgi:rod shape-determining protein MreD
MQTTNSSTRILLPVRPWFIGLSFILAFTLNCLPLGRLTAMPDWLALVLAFWCVREPYRVGMSSAFLLGLLMDVAQGAVLGQHSLAYVVLAYGAGALSRRILWFPLLQQAAHIFPLLLFTQSVMLAARMLAGAHFPGALYFASSLVGALMWTPLTYVLLLPQFQPIEKDDNRPI